MRDTELRKLLQQSLPTDAFALVSDLLTEMEAQLLPMVIEVGRKASAETRAACAQIARDFASGFQPGTVEGDISYAAAMAVAKLIEGGGK